MVTVFHYTPVNAKQFDGLNTDGLAGKHQKGQNFPCQNFVLHGCGIIINFRATGSSCNYK